MGSLRVALGQINTVVGDLDGNTERILAAYDRAAAAGADLIVFPELTVTGYPPEDLVLKPRFVADNLAIVEKIAQRTTAATAALVGFVDDQPDAGADARPSAYDAAAWCVGGSVHGIYRKRLLPNYAVFDEQRYFTPGGGPMPTWMAGDVPVGVVVCEDTWFDGGPVVEAARSGAELVVVLNASPYFAGRLEERIEMLRDRAAEARVPIVYVNLVGGQDELVFDGGSLVVLPDGDLPVRLPQFREAVAVVDLEVGPTPSATLVEGPAADALDAAGEMYEALVLGTHDYVRKNGADRVWIGLSGGVDSALVAAVAADALGPERVHGVLLPSRFSSEGSIADAEALAANLGLATRTIPIEPAHAAVLEMLDPWFAGTEPGTAEENVQARLRGLVLMALSNKEGGMVLSTGNKSELAVGYATLYGDMNGGFNPIKDVFKTRVYELCRWRNQRAIEAGERPPIPESILTKPPSAELRPDQRDDQSLPPYDELDAILLEYVERDRTAADLVEHGHDEDLVRRIVGMVDGAEYKRRQSCPGVRVTPKAFGKDRRLPITNAYRG